MNDLLQYYLPLVIFIAVAFTISLALLLVPFLVAYKQPDPEKLSAYECGFNAFDDARMKFDVRFYLVAILFIIFDLEVSFLFPWAVAFGDLGFYGYWSMMIFLGVLTSASYMSGGKERWNGIREHGGCAARQRHSRSGNRPGRRRQRQLLYGPERASGGQGFPCHRGRRSHHLGAHRLADVDDVRACMLRD